MECSDNRLEDYEEVDEMGDLCVGIMGNSNIIYFLMIIVRNLRVYKYIVQQVNCTVYKKDLDIKKVAQKKKNGNEIIKRTFLCNHAGIYNPKNS